MITYKSVEQDKLRVYSDNRRVGSIIRVDGGFAYQPSGSKHVGETFATVAEVKKSIEGK